MLNVATIVHRFLETRMQVHPDVVRYIAEKGDPGLIDRILETVPEDTVVVSPRHIPGMKWEKDGLRFLPDLPLEVVQGSEGSASGISGTEAYIQYFRERYSRLGTMIRGRCSAMPIEALTRTSKYRGEVSTVIGMAGEIRNTTNGHRLVDLEDPTGSISVLFHKGRPCYPDAEQIIPDEVIGVRGTQSPDGRLLFADQIFRPDVPISHAPYTGNGDGTAVLISDIHVGSQTFLADAWERFATWIEDTDVSCLLVAWDLVDGIGVYPGQEKELTIPDIYAQYAELAGMLSALPSRLRIILSPGNHDVVRGVEPQPAIPPAFRTGFPPNCTFVESPSLVNIQGVRFLLYHGRSMDDMIGLIPGATYEDPVPLLEGMLKRRHLAPTYGRRTPLAPDSEDRLIIDPIPEVLHTGHIHISGITRYRGVLAVNAGTWQAQTTFQKQMNVNPTPARAVTVDLRTLSARTLDFLDPSLS